MRKRLILSILFISYSFFIYSQKTIELDKQWNVVDYKVFTPNKCTNIYSFQRDTIINSTNYLELFFKRDTAFSAQWKTTDVYMREDSLHRIYVLDRGVEKMLYDFTLSVGDTFQVDYNYSNCELLVYQIDSVQLLNGDMRKRIRLIKSDEQNPNQTLYDYKDWIQGIGSTTNLIAYLQSCMTDYPYNLLCYYENNEIVYSYPENDECFITPVNDVYTSESITIFPNPAQSVIQIKTNAEIEQINIITLHGKIILSGKQSSLNVSQLHPGIYFVQVKTDKGLHTQKLLIER